MRIFSNQTSKEQRNLWSIFTPSVLSITVSALVVIVAVGGTIFLTVYHTSGAPQFISQLNDNTSNKSVLSAYSKTNNFLNGNSAFSDAPLAMFWALVGVGVYAIVMSLSSFFRNIAETKRETTFMHVNKQNFQRMTLARLLVRLVGITLTWFVLEGVVRYVFPYALAAAHVAAQGSWWQHFTYAIAACASIFLALHVLIVVVRLIWLRVRLFS
jgi:hypothetical protein